MNRIAPWNVVHSCHRCLDGWLCEQHPEKPWPHDDCAGPGVPCPGLLEDTAVLETEANT